jgi:hypothetical protein
LRSAPVRMSLRRRWFAINGVSVATPASVAVRRELRRTPDLEEMDWGGTERICATGAWSARAMLGLVAAYVSVLVVGFTSLGNLSKPLPDPYLAIAEGLILVMAPIMVALMLAIHACAPVRAKPFTQVALGWMLAAAAFTTTVHFVELTVARHINQATFPGYARIFDFKWPSMLYAIDIAAWDIFFGLALLFAVPAFARGSKARARFDRERPTLPDRARRTFHERPRLASDRDLRIHDRVRAYLHPAQPDVRLRTSHRLGIAVPISARRRIAAADVAASPRRPP